MKKKTKRSLLRAVIILIIVALILLCILPLSISDSYAISKSGNNSVTNVVIQKNPEKDTVITKPVEKTAKGISENTAKVELTIEQKIQKACETHGVPFDIALAISRLETGWFTSDAYLYRNNPGGLSKNEIPISFSSIDEGVEAFVSNLYKNYISEGLCTPSEIGEKYCPVDSNWASKVESLMVYGVN